MAENVLYDYYYHYVDSIGYRELPAFMKPRTATRTGAFTMTAKRLSGVPQAPY